MSKLTEPADFEFKELTALAEEPDGLSGHRTCGNGPTDTGLADLCPVTGGDCLEDSGPVKSKPSSDFSAKRAPQREPIAGKPYHAEEVMERDLSSHLIQGDHVLFSVIQPPYSPCYQSALVVSAVGNTVVVIMNDSEGVVEDKVVVGDSTKLYKVQYDSNEYTVEFTMDRARKRLNWGEKRFDYLSNQSHHFVTWAKTGREDPLADILVHLDAMNEDALRSDECPTEVGSEPETAKGKPQPEEETCFGSPTDGTNLLSAENIAKSTILPDALRSDECPTEVRSEPETAKGKPQPEEETCFGSPTDGAHLLSAENIATSTLLPDALGSDECPTEVGSEPETVKGKPQPEEETCFGSPTDGANLLSAENIATSSTLLPDTLRPDQPPTEDLKFGCEMGKLKPVDGTHMDGPASETDYQPVEDMVDTALLPERESGGIELCLKRLSYSASGTALKPVLTKVEVESLDDIQPGDHITILDSFSKQSHLIVNSVDLGQFTAFTCERKRILLKNLILKRGRMHRIDYKCKHLLSHEETHEKAEELRTATTPSPYTDSSKFATNAKIGHPYSFSEECVFDSSKQTEPVSCTKITAQVMVSSGDHLVLKSQEGKWQSLLVKDSSRNGIATLQLITNNKVQLQEDILVCSDQELYRVNYLQTFPPGITIERALSPEGRDECKDCPDCFVAWAKTGRKVATHMEKLKEKLQIEDKTPTHTEKVYSVSSIKVGDHLIQRATVPVTYWHYMVTEALPVEGKFMVITSSSLQHVNKREEEITVDPSSTPFYKVIYPESLTPTHAVKRARSMLKSEISLTKLIRSRLAKPDSEKGCSKLESQKVSLAQLIRWAKTDSDKGLDGDLLMPSSLPLTKSRICSAAQLNPGDYVTFKESEHSWTHHYLVTKIHSPNDFSGIEYFRLKVSEGRVPLTEDCCDGYPACYRINYAEATCVSPEHAISKARSLKQGKLGFLHVPPTTAVRERFVHYVKTDECVGINTESLEDDRLFLRRERIQSAKELFIGDHIERPLCGAIGTMRKAYHHMLVAEKSVSDQRIKVLHYTSPGIDESTTRLQNLRDSFKVKAVVKEEVTDIFVMGEVFRIKYPDRIPPAHGISQLQAKAEKVQKNYHFTKHNCENLVMTATVDRSISIQVDDVVRKLITYTRNAVRPVGIATGASAFRASQKGATKAAVMASTAKHAAVSGRSAAKGVSKPAAKGAHAAQSTGFRIGYDTSISAASLGAAAGVSAFVAIPTEAAVATYFSLKHRRKRELGLISNDELIKEVAKKHIIAVNTAALSIAGAVAGTAAIPIPVLGASVGGFLGCLAGQALGHTEGKLFDLIYDYWLGGGDDLPPVCNHVFYDCPTPDEANQ